MVPGQYIVTWRVTMYCFVFHARVIGCGRGHRLPSRHVPVGVNDLALLPGLFWVLEHGFQGLAHFRDVSPGHNPVLIVQQALTAKSTQEEVDLVTRVERLVDITEEEVVVGMCCTHPNLPHIARSL